MRSRLVATALALSVLTGCDAVRVEGEATPAEGIHRIEHGEVVLLSTAAVDEAALGEAARYGLRASGESRRALDVAAYALAGLEARACERVSGAASSGCAFASATVDAAVVDSTGLFGAVAAVTGAKHPAMAARMVAETPFGVMVGDSALELVGGGRAPGMSRNALVGPPLPEQPDTLALAPQPFAGDGGYGALVRMGDGRFAVAFSTAGAARVPRGRLTAVAIDGATLHAGELGAVVVTGDARWLIRERAARRAYEMVADGLSSAEATQWLEDHAPATTPVGVAIIDATGVHVGGRAAPSWARIAIERRAPPETPLDE